jgi:transcription elongation factor GreA
MPETPYLTAAGAEKLRAELAHLTSVERPALAQRLRSAIQMGDLSENADYHKAKEDQAFLEGRILELEFVLNNAIIVEATGQRREVADVGATVTVQEEDFEPETYLLVGAKEANPREGKISNESPIGRALIGRRAGERVTAQTPGGEISLKILKVE